MPGLGITAGAFHSREERLGSSQAAEWRSSEWKITKRKSGVGRRGFWQNRPKRILY